MKANTPAELQSLLLENINTGDLDAIVACYEPEAVFVLPKDQGGEARGREAIGQAYTQFLAAKPKLTVNATVTVEAGGVAAILGEWALEGISPEGNPSSASGKLCNIVRQQPNNAWLYLIDNPFRPG
jgi:ketosteroid isomerase-like protein